jgi:hypothetical protein
MTSNVYPSRLRHICFLLCAVACLGLLGTDIWSMWYRTIACYESDWIHSDVGYAGYRVEGELRGGLLAVALRSDRPLMSSDILAMESEQPATRWDWDCRVLNSANHPSDRR